MCRGFDEKMQGTQFDINDLLLSITNFCHGSCAYCNLKSLHGFFNDREIDVLDMERLLIDPYLDNLKNIHITGGEPVLSPKLWELSHLIKDHHPDIRVNMPISGFFPYVTYRYLKRILPIIPQLRIDISVDGTSKKVHEKTRGEGSWEPLNKTIELLRSMDGLKLQFQLTLMESNVEEITKIREWGESMDIGFYLCFPRFGTRFGHSEDKSHEHTEQFIEKVNEQIKDGWCKIRPLNAQIWETQKAIWRNQPVYHDCYMGLKSIDIDPYGNVYPCMVYNKEQTFGNIKMNPLHHILEKEKTREILQRIKNRKCQPCVMPVCPWKKDFIINGKEVDF